MKSFTRSSFGFARAGTLRSGGTALAIACRTIRRCTPNCFATPRIVPTPKRYSRLICSNTSTLRLLSIALPVLAGQNRVGRSIAIYKVGPNQTANLGPDQSSEIKVNGVVYFGSGQGAVYAYGLKTIEWRDN